MGHVDVASEREPYDLFDHGLDAGQVPGHAQEIALELLHGQARLPDP
jgi:hypothetical protein